MELLSHKSMDNLGEGEGQRREIDHQSFGAQVVEGLQYWSTNIITLICDMVFNPIKKPGEGEEKVKKRNCGAQTKSAFMTPCF